MLTERIAAIHARSRQTYGAPRVHAELHVCGELHGRKRVARLMRSAGLAGRVPKRFRRTTVGDPVTVLPDLVQRDFTPTRLDQCWEGDITYIRTWETRAAARNAVFEYIEVFYNRERRHSTLGNLSPGGYEARHDAVCAG